jgi:hypothetical protein
MEMRALNLEHFHAGLLIEWLGSFLAVADEIESFSVNNKSRQWMIMRVFLC